MKVIKISFDIKIVFDNKCVREGFLPGFGFSALVYNHFTNNHILFDTGGDGQVLLHNLKQFSVDPSDIKKIIISHNHFDHIGALTDVYHRHPEVSLYVPNGLENYRYQFPNAQIDLFKNLNEIEQNVYISGQFGTSIKEQALILNTKDNHLILIVGCTHPGLENFIIEARKLHPIKALIGGFHGFRKYSYLEGIDFIGACHCTANVSDIKKRFPNQYKKVCVGDNFSF